jgi:hypothetical protein
MLITRMLPPAGTPLVLLGYLGDTPEKRRLLRRLACLDASKVKTFSRLVALLLLGRGARK